eukprot:TRINITY_DN1166_c0_g1_i2.p4 TRINITY_DN1166_c0_g1~~TRINITY_DN1166_c0_g1_i2.p4  ORF type:complete len:143 (-),score=30.49 TRINITY_DN1166_c0_g1_i2:229-657(-)
MFGVTPHQPQLVAAKAAVTIHAEGSGMPTTARLLPTERNQREQNFVVRIRKANKSTTQVFYDERFRSVAECRGQKRRPKTTMTCKASEEERACIGVLYGHYRQLLAEEQPGEAVVELPEWPPGHPPYSRRCPQCGQQVWYCT